MKRTLCLLMCLLIAATSLAGCASHVPVQTSAPAATATLAATATPAATVEATPEPTTSGTQPLVAEKVTLTFGTHQGTNAAIAPPSNDLPIYQYLEKLTNVHIEWQTAPYDTYKEVMNTRIASGDKLPDILNLNGLGNYQTLALDKVIIPQTDLIEKYAPYTKLFFEKNPAYKKLMTAPDGQIYCIEDTVLDSHLPMNIMIDKYALERAGIAAMPTTVDEFYKMLVAFKDKDINGNKKKDEVPLVIDKENLVSLGNAFGLQIAWGWNKYFAVQDGKLVNNYSLPAYKEYITFLNKLYSEGLMNKDFATINYDKIIENVTKGVCGAVGYWSSYAYLLGDASPDAAPFKADKKGEQVPIYVPMDPLKDANGQQFFVKRSGLNGDGMGITVDCPENLKPVAMKWIDFLFGSPDSLTAQYFGVPGVTYNAKADGTIEKITPPSGKEWGAYVTEIGGNQPPRAHQQLIEGWRNSWLPQWLDVVDQGMQKFYKDGDILPIQFTKDEEDSIAKVTTDLNTYIDENIISFITGTKPMSGYDAFAAGMNNRGLDVMQKAYESRYLRQIGK